jgi:hypothetical protein
MPHSFKRSDEENSWTLCDAAQKVGGCTSTPAHTIEFGVPTPTRWRLMLMHVILLISSGNSKDGLDCYRVGWRKIRFKKKSFPNRVLGSFGRFPSGYVLRTVHSVWCLNATCSGVMLSLRYTPLFNLLAGWGCGVTETEAYAWKIVEW